MTSLKTILTVVFQSNTGNVILWNAWDPEPDPKWGRFQDRDLKGSTTLPWGMRHSTFITLVTNCRDLSEVAQRMRNSGYPHLSCLSCYHPQGSVWSCTAHAQQRLSSFITLVTTPRDLSGVVQRMRNRRIIHIYHTCYSVWSCTVHAQQVYYLHLSCLLPTAGICMELHRACATGIIPNYHAFYHPQWSAWSCTVHAQKALFPIITLVTTRSDLSGVAQSMRNRHYSQLSLLLPTAGVCLELRSACATGIIPN